MQTPLILFLPLFLATTLFPFLNEPGETVLPSLKMTAGPRAQALGGAGVAAEGDGAGATLNPAGLQDIEEDQIFLEHLSLYQNMKSEFISALIRYPHFRLCASLQYMDLGFGPITNSEGSDYSEENTFHAFDAAFMLTGSFEYHQTRIGITLKALREEIWYYGSNGLAMDIGLIRRGLWDNHLSIGASLMNLGYATPFDKKRYPLTTLFRTGIAYEYELTDEVTLLGLSDLNLSNDGQFTLPLGLEAQWTYVRARAGYHLLHDTRTFSLGGGVEFSRFVLDYSYIRFGNDWNSNGTPHLFSLTIRI